MPRHYLRVHMGRAHGPDTVFGYVAWDQHRWPFRLSTPIEWSTEPVTLEVASKERWMMQPCQLRAVPVSVTSRSHRCNPLHPPTSARPRRL